MNKEDIQSPGFLLIQILPVHLETEKLLLIFSTTKGNSEEW